MDVGRSRLHGRHVGTFCHLLAFSIRQGLSVQQRCRQIKVQLSMPHSQLSVRTVSAVDTEHTSVALSRLHHQSVLS